jgi:glucosamine-6-phosphate deaminase
MKIEIFPDKQEMGAAAAQRGAMAIRQATEARGAANIIVATGASQFEMLAELAASPDLDWSKVACFHLDEYVGLTEEHPASFCKYLRERFVEKLPQPPKAFHYIHPGDLPEQEIAKLNNLIQQIQIDVAFIGIGENGHLAFNDPPADFETEQPYLVVKLDEACRKQQLGEGWFQTLAAVPKKAISMSVRQILKSREIVCTVPDKRKSVAVRDAVQGDVSPAVPASILQQHANTTLFLDEPAASLLKKH